jgi:putative SOS response-associated peptidase YedK
MRDPGCLPSKPALRSAYERRRCILFADGFYEWKNRRRVSVYGGGSLRRDVFELGQRRLMERLLL